MNDPHGGADISNTVTDAHVAPAEEGSGGLIEYITAPFAWLSNLYKGISEIGGAVGTYLTSYTPSHPQPAMATAEAGNDAGHGSHGGH